MKRFRLFVIFVSVPIVFGFAIANYAVAEEHRKATGVSVRTKFHPIEVGDEEGHIIAVFESTTVYTDSDSGENSVGTGKGQIDMNVKTGKGTMKGYTVRTFQNGDTYVSEWEGKPVGKGTTQGTYKIVKGTGTLEGLTGEGNWKTKSLAPGVSIGEYEGVRKMPGK